MELNGNVSSANMERAELTLNRVGTCMAWQWMCPNHCGYVLGIDSSREHIITLAARHLDVCDAVSATSVERLLAEWQRGQIPVDAVLAEVERIIAGRLAMVVANLMGPIEALAAKWDDVISECKGADPRWTLDRSVTTLETALSELRAAMAGR